jgi:Predicted metal-dependent hydrolase with the TIM-barrel fold
MPDGADGPLERRVPRPGGTRVAGYTRRDFEAGGSVGGNGSAADLVFVNGAVYTVDAMRSWAQAVAVRDGRVALVGTDDDVRAPSARGPR